MSQQSKSVNLDKAESVSAIDWRRAHEALMCLPEAKPARDWLESRNFTPTAWIRYRLGYQHDLTSVNPAIFAPAISFPWLVRGRVRAIDFLLLDSDGSENWHCFARTPLQTDVLYGGHAISDSEPGMKTLFIAEGRLNTLSLHLTTTGTNVDVLGVNELAESLPSSFFDHASKYKKVIFWLSRASLLQQAARLMPENHCVLGDGKPSPLELHAQRQLSEAVSRIRFKAAQSEEQQQELLCDLMQGAREDILGVPRGAVPTIQKLSAIFHYRDSLTEVAPARYACASQQADAPVVKTLFPVMPSQIPQELKAIPQWVGYALVPKDEGKTDKVPKNARTGGNAGVTYPATWSDFATAFNFAKTAEEVDGVAIVLSEEDNLVVVDIDNCVELDGSIQPDAQAVIDQLDSYSEVSPSGRGVHIYCFGKLPPGKRRSLDQQIEMYDAGRFMTVTGYRLTHSPKQVQERVVQLNALHAKLFGSQEAVQVGIEDEKACEEMTDDDKQLWRNIFKARGGKKILRLFEGDISVSRNDASQAVIDLGNVLAHWTEKDPVQMRRMFYQTKLVRGKWKEKRGDTTWLDYQIADCIQFVSSSSK